jgi:preprotein translocase subunit YajC
MHDVLFSYDSPDGSSMMTQFAPLLIMLGIFYFLVLRPQRQEADAHAKLVAGLKVGDKVVTNAGFYGTISEAAGTTLLLEISPKAFLTVDRDSVKRLADTPSQSA